MAAQPLQKISKGALCDLARNSELKATGEHNGRRLRYLETCYEVAVNDEPEHMKARVLLGGAHTAKDLVARRWRTIATSHHLTNG